MLPPIQLSPFLTRGWSLRWNMKAEESFEQRVLPDACVHIVVTASAAELWGVVTGAFTTSLEGRGFVLGLKFRPGGLYPFTHRPTAHFTDRRLPLREVLSGVDVDALRRLAAVEDSVSLANELHTALATRDPQADSALDEVAAICALIAESPDLLRTEDAASQSGVTVRQLQRLFHAHVGVGPKWFIRRSRMQDAAARIASGVAPSWAELALELGYYDQAHFVNEFTRLVGTPPAAYARGLIPPP